MLKTIALACTVFFCTTLHAQTTQIKGTLKDTTSNSFVQNAVVAVIRPADSLLLSFTRTGKAGDYKMTVPSGTLYTLMVMHPQYADYLTSLNAEGAEVNVGMLPMTSRSQLLQAVILNSTKSIRVKGDTTIFNADSFKVAANSNVEELLKKLPGLTVDKDGKITAMGKTVEKVLVDGEEFFGDDPGMAVKNLRADAVKEVQVFDKKSDQAEFTGIDDGQTKKTINLKLKESAKHGYFGKVDASAGPLKDKDARYNNNILYGNFQGNRKISLFGLNGNTGQDGLGWEDENKYGGGNDNVSMSDDGGMMFFSGGGGSDGEPYVDTRNGFIKNVNLGASYSNKWNDKQTLNFSPKYNSQIYNNSTKTFTQTQIGGDSILNYNSDRDSYVNRNNFKTSGNYEIKLDSASTLKFTAAANFYKTESTENGSSQTTGENGNLKNSTARRFSTNTDKQALSATVLYKHKFDKARRTFTLKGSISDQTSSGLNLLKSENINLVENISIPINQQFDNDKKTTNLSAEAVYTEPLGKKYAAEFGYNLSVTDGTNDQTTFSYNNGNGKYDNMVDSLTNNFDQHIITNKPSAKLSYNFKKFKWYAGSGFGITKFDFKDKTYNNEYNRNFTNIFPSAGLTYTYKSNHSISVNYNGSTTQPTLNQLQPLRNNNDQFNLYIGNPDLKQSFSNRINFGHNAYNFIKGLWMYQNLSFSTTSNAITNSRTIDAASGKTTSQPVNTDGNFNSNFYGGIGTKLKKSDIQVYLNTNANYSQYADIINSNRSLAKTLNAGIGLQLNKTKSKKYEFSFSNNVNFVSNTNGQSDTRNKYRTYDGKIDATIYYKKVWSINTDYNLQARQKTAQITDNLTNQLWNARLQRTFKSDIFTAYLKVRDILNQNIGIDRNFYGNTFTETRNERLQRYFLVGFTWNFKNKVAAPADKK